LAAAAVAVAAAEVETEVETAAVALAVAVAAMAGESSAGLQPLHPRIPDTTCKVMYVSTGVEVRAYSQCPASPRRRL
jgi:hypothetical protein